MAERAHHRKLVNLVFWHHGSFGDIVYAFSVVEEYKKKFEKEDTGVHVTFLVKDRLRFEQFLRLTSVQPYIDRFSCNTGGTIRNLIKRLESGKPTESVNIAEVPELYTLNLDMFDETVFVDLATHYKRITLADRKLHLVECNSQSLGIDVDMHRPWLHNVEPSKTTNGKIVVNLTPRYKPLPGQSFEIADMQAIRDRCVFIGLPREHVRYVNFYGQIDYISCWDVLSMAEEIAGCSLFLGNQSCAFSLAEALKVPRLLTESKDAPNCTPSSNNGHVYKSSNDLHMVVNMYASG